ncbi:hypothetical protein SAMD00019534_120810, partial [Acytostelium subglobosum LB1]|uniref:hypothetical protein n=1 Tax=Acytostelium subglobosum LB1 TaxID=1410327 RepID=UPI0006450579
MRSYSTLGHMLLRSTVGRSSTATTSMGGQLIQITNRNNNIFKIATSSMINPLTSTPLTPSTSSTSTSSSISNLNNKSNGGISISMIRTPMFTLLTECFISSLDDGT